MRPRMVAVVQTASELARWYPHVQVLVSRGGWTSVREWVPVPYVDEHMAELLYRHRVIRLLQDVGLLAQERTELLPSWWLTGFSFTTRRDERVAVGRPAPSPTRLAPLFDLAPIAFFHTDE